MCYTPPHVVFAAYLTGVYKGPHPVPGGGRIVQALRTGGAGK